MLFNTPEYIAFLAIIFVLVVWTNRIKKLQIRNILLLIGSIYFYANLHTWFVILLIYMTSVNYICGIEIEKAKDNKKRKKIVTLSILLSIGILAFFKYAYIWNSSILLPVGLSFFTFQALTYTIDIYRNKIKAETNLIDLALFVSFFPTLLSGPIERARILMPQLKETATINWENIIDSIKLFTWGLFKKIVIADRLAEYVNAVYLSPDSHTGSTLALAVFFYSFQIYCDFSGYADMAIASGKILGFQLSRNFNLPYFASTIKDFWRRWHISLTSWFTEYVYISMGGNRVSKVRWVLNISTVFLLSGIWHGATVSFILWGALHAILYLFEYFKGPKQTSGIYHLFIFILISFVWIFFRIEDFHTACNILVTICTDLFTPIYLGSSAFSTVLTSILLLGFIFREYLFSKKILEHTTSIECTILFLLIALFSVSSEQFVYFQF